MYDSKAIKAVLAQLAEQNRQLGGMDHEYRLNDPLDEGEVAEFERTYSVSLPEQYRSFLLTVGNGGCGPSYGIGRLGHLDGMPLHDDELQRLAGDFPHTDEWKPDDTSEGDWDLYYAMPGYLRIGEIGCACWWTLIVSGPARGQVWEDGVGGGQSLRPVVDSVGKRMNFRDWWLGWLDDRQTKMLGSSG